MQFQKAETMPFVKVKISRVPLWLFLVWTVLSGGRPAWTQPAAQKNLSSEIQERLRNRIEAAGPSPELVVGDELIHASIVLPMFYQRRIFQPAWCSDQGPLDLADQLVSAIKQAVQEGLTPEDYHLGKIESSLDEVRSNQERNILLNLGRMADLDLLCTDAFLIYGSHLLAGKVNPEKIDSEWFAYRREKDLSQVLETALQTGQIEESLKNLLPQQPGYARLRQTLSEYRALSRSGEWPKVTEGKKMQKGDENERVGQLRQRLRATEELEPLENNDENAFDEELDQVVRRFQESHGLDVDGAVGPKTLEELNVPVGARIRQIELNMERWRWLPQELGQDYIIVNIADFRLEVVKEGQTVLSMKVIVGKDYRRTPVFSAKVAYMVFNPYWNIPKKIAVEDKLPLIKKDVSYLEKQKIRIFQGWGAEAIEIDPKTIDWEKVSPKNFVYRLRQDPGSINALGRMKFMFPNRFEVYLHDTPSRELFAKAMRTFSSGCIRIERPVDLAEYILQPDSSWTREKILEAIDKNIDQIVNLPRSIPVHLLYWTAWVEEDGAVRFRKDIYGRDKRLDEALRETSPTVSMR